MRSKKHDLIVHIPKTSGLEQSIYLDQLDGIHDGIETICIYLEPGTRATVCDRYASNTIQSIEIVLAEQAQLSYRYDRNSGISTTRCTVSLHKKSSFYGMITIAGGNDTSFFLTMNLLDSEAEAHVSALYRLRDDHRCVIKTDQHHAKDSTVSTVSVYGIVENYASVDYHGLIAIEDAANGSQAKQINKTILIGQHACALSVPSLEVHTDDVRCKHGTAIGRLDDEQLFYMQGRGLSYEHAQKLALKAFLSQAADELPKDMRVEVDKNIDSLMI